MGLAPRVYVFLWCLSRSLFMIEKLEGGHHGHRLSMQPPRTSFPIKRMTCYEADGGLGVAAGQNLYLTQATKHGDGA